MFQFTFAVGNYVDFMARHGLKTTGITFLPLRSTCFIFFLSVSPKLHLRYEGLHSVQLRK